MDTDTTPKPDPEFGAPQPDEDAGEAADAPSPSNGGPEPSEEPGGENGGLSDQELVERARDTSGLKDLSGGDAEEDEPSRAGVAAVAAARDGKRMKPGEQSSALDWFLNEDPRSSYETQVVELNFGTQEDPVWIYWTIKPVPMEVMRSIRKKAANTRLARTTGETDEYRVNLEILLEGTVDPDIREATKILNEQGRFSGDPADALRNKFQTKPGYVAQLAGRIMTLSGFNDEDVRDAERAAKN